MQRSNKKPRVPTSRGRSTKPRLPPVRPLLLLLLRHTCPRLWGAGQGEGWPSFMCKAWDAQTGLPPWLNCAHVSTHAHAQTRKSSHTRDTAGLCISGVAGGGGAGCSVLGTHVLNSLPLSVSSAAHRGPVPCGCPPVSPQPAASPVGGLSTGSHPPFAGLLAALWVGFLREDPLELRWEGGKVSSENCPHHPRGRTFL